MDIENNPILQVFIDGVVIKIGEVRDTMRNHYLNNMISITDLVTFYDDVIGGDIISW